MAGTNSQNYQPQQVPVVPTIERDMYQATVATDDFDMALEVALGGKKALINIQNSLNSKKLDLQRQYDAVNHKLAKVANLIIQYSGQ